MENAQQFAPGFDLSPLGSDDITAATALVVEAGWNQMPEDWQTMLSIGNAVGLFREKQGPLATALSLPFDGPFGWISMVLVAKTWRRRGLASALLRACINELKAAGKIPMLDATEAGRSVYLPLGFEDIYPFSRWLTPQATPCPVPEYAGQIRPIIQNDMNSLCDWDAVHFGADRRKILQALMIRAPGTAFLAQTSNNDIEGYVLGRNGRAATQIGPVVASDTKTAMALLATALGQISGPVFIDVGDHHAAIVDWLTALGFRRERGFMRMALGASEPFDDPNCIIAMAGPELG